MTRQVEFYFDYGSPASYIAWTQIPAIATRTHAELIYRPMLLGGVFKAVGNASPVTVKPKGVYMWQDFARWADRWGVPLVKNSAFPVNTLQLMRGAVAAEQEGMLEGYSKAVFEAIWTADRNMADAAVFAEVMRDAGLDPDHFLERAAHPDVKQQLIANTEEAVARGVFGAPTFFVGDQMFWGQDRLDFVEGALTASE